MPRARKSLHKCSQCRLGFPTKSRVHWHISHSPLCQACWEYQKNWNEVATAVPNQEEGGIKMGYMSDVGNDNQDVDMSMDAPRPYAAWVEDETDVEGDNPCYALANILGKGETAFEKMKETQDGLGGSVYSPFEDREEWELAQWLINNVNQQATDDFLKLQVVGDHYGSNHTFMKIVDKLPTSPEWKCELVHTYGDVEDIRHDLEGKEDPIMDGEEMELWMCDPVACIRELIRNLAFHGNITYTPKKVYMDHQGSTQWYDEMWTGDWWWETQHHLPPGGTVTPVILVSDKTELSLFKGDKNAWPMYLSIGNLSKEVCCQPGCHALVLLGYLPVSKLERILHPLVDAGRNGVEMVCTDRQIRRCLIACCAENRCPKCLVPAKERGINTPFQPCDQMHTTCTLHAQATGQYLPEFIAQGLRPIFSPFWADLPHANIFTMITPDILHQLHQGIIKDHFKRWCMVLMGKANFDARFHAMPVFPGLRHFKEGISKVKQWTGADHKQVQCVFLVALVGAAPHPDVIKAGSNLLDFIYLTQYQSHMDCMLAALQQALDSFHVAKDIFIELACCKHFNVPKIHSLQHYMETIKSLGSLNGLNMETLEWLHINFAKKAYSASNQRDYLVQMTRWLQCQEAIFWFSSYLTWHNGNIQPDPQPTDCCNGSDDSDQPQFPRRTVQYLQQNHGAVRFVHTLQDFLSTSTNRHGYFQLNVNDRFDCFSNISIQVLHHEHMVNRNLFTRPPMPARFDTVLALFNEELQQHGGFHGLHVTEIHVIFKLLCHLGNYPQPLAYVHWFKPLSHFDRNVGMFCATCSTQQHLPSTTIIPVPRFPNGAINPHWIQGHIMTDADIFYLNRYIDFNIFDQYQNHF
ncbi:hypothetical protein EDC04DRAFT_2879042 [Pisolithus marmoratus]|nr:hypothetical protein EDC04DRAFT_2879042 [Pisolithus marmoratus]